MAQAFYIEEVLPKHIEEIKALEKYLTIVFVYRRTAIFHMAIVP